MNQAVATIVAVSLVPLEETVALVVSFFLLALWAILIVAILLGAVPLARNARLVRFWRRWTARGR